MGNELGITGESFGSAFGGDKTIREDGKWSDQTDFRCGCGKDIEKIKFVDSQTLIITCSNGKRFKKTLGPYGGSSETGI